MGPHSILSTAEVLTAKFSELFPHVKIGRPGRFLETVRRLQAPLRSGRLKGSCHRSYLKRTWMPRLRNMSSISTGKSMNKLTAWSILYEQDPLCICNRL